MEKVTPITAPSAAPARDPSAERETLERVPLLVPLHTKLDHPDPPAVLWYKDDDGGRGDTLLAAGEVGILAGSIHVALMTLGLQWAVAASRDLEDGSPPSNDGVGARPGSAVFAARCISPGQIARWASDMVGGDRLPQRLLVPNGIDYLIGPDARMDDDVVRTPRSWFRFWETVKDHQASLVVLKLMDYVTPQTNMDIHATAATVMEHLSLQATSAQCGLLLLMNGRPDSPVTGSVAWMNAASTVLCLVPRAVEEKNYVLDCAKSVHRSLPWRGLRLKQERAGFVRRVITRGEG